MPQTLISMSLGHAQPSRQVSWKSVVNFNRQIDNQQTESITFNVDREVIIIMIHCNNFISTIITVTEVKYEAI